MQKPDKASLIPAAAYLRMSSDDQRTSLRQQEAEVRALAERDGYAISRWYREEGKSGLKEQGQRAEFQQMLLDAADGHFQAVLCYDSSRFARLDSIDGAFAKQVLRSKGIYLVTVKEGRIDWTTFDGRVMDMLVSEANHKYSRDLSLVSLRGRMDRLTQGLWPHGTVPYGYDRLYSSGNHTHRTTRNEPFRKPRNWVLTLVENPVEAPVVRELFATYRREDTSLRQLALDLSRRGVVGPKGKGGWTKDTVKAILANRTYLGFGRIGFARRRQKESFNRAVPTEVAGVCPALVDEETFKAVQVKLEVLHATGRRPQKYRSSVLSGVLVCGHCGYRL
jgi:DNA invertase Pin-like site-specific DNA recombinase